MYFSGLLLNKYLANDTPEKAVLWIYVNAVYPVENKFGYRDVEVESAKQSLVKFSDVKQQ